MRPDTAQGGGDAVAEHAWAEWELITQTHMRAPADAGAFIG